MGVPLRPLLDWEVFSLRRRDHPLRDRSVAVDASNFLGQALFGRQNFDQRGRWVPRRDAEGRVVVHLEVALLRIVGWLRAGIRPFFCFDGKASPLKRRVELSNPIRWHADLLGTIRGFVALGRTDLAKRAWRDRRLSWETCLQDLRELCRALGVPQVNAAGEGEAQACHLAKTGVADAVASQDYDAVLYHPPAVVRNLQLAPRRRGGYGALVRPELIRPDAVLKYHGISRFQLLDAAIMLGTDYNEPVRGVGPTRALNLVRAHGCLESVVEAVGDKFDFSGLLEVYEDVRDQFLFPEVNEAVPVPRWRAPFVEKARELVLEKHGLTRAWELASRTLQRAFPQG
ncbi:MAG: flap endonuclease-1 [Promethearchaeota archaeon]